MDHCKHCTVCTYQYQCWSHHLPHELPPFPGLLANHDAEVSFKLGVPIHPADHYGFQYPKHQQGYPCQVVVHQIQHKDSSLKKKNNLVFIATYEHVTFHIPETQRNQQFEKYVLNAQMIVFQSITNNHLKMSASPCQFTTEQHCSNADHSGHLLQQFWILAPVAWTNRFCFVNL